MKNWKDDTNLDFTIGHIYHSGTTPEFNPVFKMNVNQIKQEIIRIQQKKSILSRSQREFVLRINEQINKEGL